MAVDGGAQVVHDALSDGVGDQRLSHSKRARGDCDRDHPRDQAREQDGVALRDRLVEDGAQQERRDHPERG